MSPATGTKWPLRAANLALNSCSELRTLSDCFMLFRIAAAPTFFECMSIDTSFFSVDERKAALEIHPAVIKAGHRRDRAEGHDMGGAGTKRTDRGTKNRLTNDWE